jgi:hypothetical protein
MCSTWYYQGVSEDALPLPAFQSPSKTVKRSAYEFMSCNRSSSSSSSDSSQHFGCSEKKTCAAHVLVIVHPTPKGLKPDSAADYLPDKRGAREEELQSLHGVSLHITAETLKCSAVMA